MQSFSRDKISIHGVDMGADVNVTTLAVMRDRHCQQREFFSNDSSLTSQKKKKLKKKLGDEISSTILVSNLERS
jgi:hypothetical protein